MQLNIKLQDKYKVERIFKRFTNDTFDVTDIVELLPILRENFKDYRLVWDFGSFIAHPGKREMGVFHEEFDVCYSQFKYIPPNGGAFTINPNKVEIEVFEIFVLGSLNRFSDRELKSNTGFSIIKAKELIKKTYKKDGNYYIIGNPIHYEQVAKILDPVTSRFEVKVAISNDKIYSEFGKCFHSLAKGIGIQFNSKEFFKKHKYKFILCLMACINTTEFNLFDGETGSCMLMMQPNSEKAKKGEFVSSLALSAVVNILGSPVSWPLMILNKDVMEFINIQVSEATPIIPISPSYTAIRNSEGKLILGERV